MSNNMAVPEPLAMYREVRFDQTRLFRLFNDSIEVRGKSFNSNFELTYQLRTLDPVPEKVWFRGELFNTGISLCLLSMFLVFIEMIAMDPWVELASKSKLGIVALVVVMALTGLVFVLANWRKMEFLRFKNDSGLVVLDLGRTRKSSAEFESFAELLKLQIQRAKSPSSS